MQPISDARHQFPAEIIRDATWVYLRLALSYRDAEEFSAERGLELPSKTVRRWVVKFGAAFVRNTSRLRSRPTRTWSPESLAPIGGA